MKLSTGDTISATLTRRPIYASATAGAERETKRKLTVTGVSDFLPNVYSVAISDGRRGRLTIGRNGVELSLPKSRYEVQFDSIRSS